MKDWNPEQYTLFLKERSLPSKDLCAKINIENPKKIIDIGCGPGNSTKILHEKFPSAKVIGADLSDEMLQAAQTNNPDLSFMKFDANSDFSKLSSDFDVVFSNACIQWIPDHKKVINDMFGILSPNGVLAIQIPVNFNEPIHVCLEELGRSEEWFSKIGINQIFYREPKTNYFDYLADLTDDFTIWETTYCHRVKSHQQIIDWYKGTGLRPYLIKLNEHDRELFCNQLLEKITPQYHVQKNGEILLQFQRLFFTATKK